MCRGVPLVGPGQVYIYVMSIYRPCAEVCRWWDHGRSKPSSSRLRLCNMVYTMSAHMSLCGLVHIRIYTHHYTDVLTNVFARMSVHTSMRISTHMQPGLCQRVPLVGPRLIETVACLYVCTHVCAHACTSVRMSVRMPVRMSVHMLVHMSAHMPVRLPLRVLVCMSIPAPLYVFLVCACLHACLRTHCL